MAEVTLGGMLGAAARDALEQALPSPTGAIPAATLAANLSGALLLGLLLEALVRGGEDSGWRRRARLVAGTGFMGGYTTYSTFAVESTLLFRHGHWGVGAAYVLLTVFGGLLAVVTGIAVAALGASRRRAARRLPLDPDVDREA